MSTAALLEPQCVLLCLSHVRAVSVAPALCNRLRLLHRGC